MLRRVEENFVSSDREFSLFYFLLIHMQRAGRVEWRRPVGAW